MRDVGARLAAAVRRLLRSLGYTLIAVGLASLVIVGLVALLTDVEADPEAAESEAAAAPVIEQTVIALIRTEDGTPGAAGLTLLASGADGSASATFIPTTTLAEVPGVGLDRIGLAQQYGGADLAAATIENAIGIQIDGTVTVDRNDLGSLLQRAGGAEIEIPSRLVARAADGTGTVAFESGTQFLNGLRLAEYWAFEQRGESELDTFPRQQRALEASLAALAEDDLVEELFSTTPRELSTRLDSAVMRTVIETAAVAARENRLAVQLLPVEPFGSTDETFGASYQIREDEVADLVATHFAGAVPDGAGDGPVAIQVLNGVGVPGIGQQVDGRLRGLDLRIVRTENARTFDFTETQIVVYDEDPELMATARQVRESLGVGTILISRQPQSVVDLTVVVGDDFLGSPAAPTDLQPGPQS